MRFSSTALHSWGTPNDASKSRISNTATTEALCANVDGVWENGQCRVFPYAEKVADIVEIGNRVYIGGSFKDLHANNNNKNPTMSGLPMDYVAELDTDGNAVPGSAFNAKVSFEQPVRALERSPDGKRLYVGGEFNKVNGENHPQLVALDPATGEIDRSFNPPVPNYYVSSIVQHGSTIYIGGAFTQIGSTPDTVWPPSNLGGSVTDFSPPPRYQGKRLYRRPARGPDPNPQQKNAPPRTLRQGRKPSRDPHGPVPPGRRDLHALRLRPHGRLEPPARRSHRPRPDHRCTRRLAAFAEQPDSKRRPAFGMANYEGNPRDIGVNGDELFFAATGGSGGRVIAWIAGGTKETPLWRGGTDGDAMGVAVTHDRVYLVGHFDHAVIDPNDDCLTYRPSRAAGVASSATRRPRAGTSSPWTSAARSSTGRTPARPSSTRASRPRPTPARARTTSTSAPTGCMSAATSPRWANQPVKNCNGCVIQKQAGFAAYPPLQ